MKEDRISLKHLSIKTREDFEEYEEEPNLQYWGRYTEMDCTLEVNSVEISAYNLELPFFLLDNNESSLEWAWGLKDRDEKGASQKEKAHFRKVDQRILSEDYLDSCSCGHAACNGYWSGIKINRKKHHFIYTAPINRGYDKRGILGTGKLKLNVPVEDVLEIRKQLTTLAKQIDPSKSVASVIYSISGESFVPTKEWVVDKTKQLM